MNNYLIVIELSRMVQVMNQSANVIALVEPVFSAKFSGVHSKQHENVPLDDDCGKHQHERKKTIILESGNRIRCSAGKE